MQILSLTLPVGFPRRGSRPVVLAHEVARFARERRKALVTAQVEVAP